ncbi:MAG: quinolinate synthase NadA [Candidatus Cloacimonetes bacterium]|nr:quinolinate synthase NadA [Candidatus Cloacimonadota bacterium]
MDITEQVTYNTVQKLKKEKNAIVLAHNYQILPVQHLADFIGDSLQLAQEAAKAKAEIIVFCGVRFMAETAKLLNPEARILLPVMEAGCPMADMLTAEQLIDFKEKHPGATVMCYVNSSVEVKAVSDICCTSSNAVKIIESLPPDEKILFVPDQNLGQYAAMKTGRNIIVWDGYCMVHHHKITLKDVDGMRMEHPDYTLMVHPECPPAIFNRADKVGSTKQMADFVRDNDKVVLGTEVGLIDQLSEMYPEKNIFPLSIRATCLNMKKTSPRDVLLSLIEEKHEIVIDPKIADAALKSVQRMLEY